MLDRLVERFCELDDFCTSIRTQWEAMLLADGKAPARKHGPESGLADSEIMCLIPGFDGALFSLAWKDALWARFCTEAPARQRRSVERYNIVKRA